MSIDDVKKKVESLFDSLKNYISTSVLNKSAIDFNLDFMANRIPPPAAALAFNRGKTPVLKKSMLVKIVDVNWIRVVRDVDPETGVEVNDRVLVFHCLSNDASTHMSGQKEDLPPVCMLEGDVFDALDDMIKKSPEYVRIDDLGKKSKNSNDQQIGGMLKKLYKLKVIQTKGN
eukprot:TRINITY_DN4356_c0_g1_i1.p1 TRINITY_DN4356_c0_g1~~TRINITY_DN4356_c0_g1_i1.p1  ORF type:complete len:191 (-),score=51.40 TRINITY_DN4356_c0_g1_i1:24-542(-)